MLVCRPGLTRGWEMAVSLVAPVPVEVLVGVYNDLFGGEGAVRLSWQECDPEKYGTLRWIGQRELQAGVDVDLPASEMLNNLGVLLAMCVVVFRKGHGSSIENGDMDAVKQTHERIHGEYLRRAASWQRFLQADDLPSC